MPMHILLYNKIGTRNIITEYSVSIEICAYKQQSIGYASEGLLWLWRIGIGGVKAAVERNIGF